MERVSSLPIAVDAMGGDHAPRVPAEAAVATARDHGLRISLVGNQDELQRLVAGLGGPIDHISFVHAPHTVQMEDQAVAAVRQKARASIPVALEEVRDGRASAMVSAGHSGAVVASALFVLGRMAGVQRPGILIPFPTSTDHLTYIIDAGAVTDPRPNHLVQYAYLATSYLRYVRGIQSPRIGLLSNGEEAKKGNSLIREVHQLLAESPHVRFAGNVEGNAVPAGVVDAVVCDGFSGNILLKSAEGVAKLLQDVLRRELSSRWYLKILAAGIRPAFRRARQSLDYREYGGAPLLGVDGIVFIAHGRSDVKALTNAILSTNHAVEHRMVEHIREDFSATTIAATDQISDRTDSRNHPA